jgi:hypothetical protein
MVPRTEQEAKSSHATCMETSVARPDASAGARSSLHSARHEDELEPPAER